MEKMEGLALVGRNVPMTSEVFCVSCGPPGGGGGTTRGPAIVFNSTNSARADETIASKKRASLRLVELSSM